MALESTVAEKKLCPLDDEELIQLILDFIDLYNNSAHVELYTYQKIFLRRIVQSLLLHDGAELTGLWSRQSGKCFRRGTLVLMYDGTTKAVERVRVGDLLMGDDSTPRRVLSLATGKEGMVRVTPNGGQHAAYVVNRSHVLSIKRLVEWKWVVRDVPVSELLGANLHDCLGYKSFAHVSPFKPPQHYGFTLEELPEERYYGFSVDGNHRFLLADCTVTHNSEAISSLAGGVCVILPALAVAFSDDPRLQQYREGVWVGIFAPRLGQSGIIYERVRKRAEKEEQHAIYRDPDLRLTLTQARGDQVAWSNGSFVSSQTASDQTNVEGRTYHLVILDESQLISRAKVDKEIRPMLAATMGTIVKIGTVHEFKGALHETVLQNVAREKRTGDRRHFEFDYKMVIEQKRKKYEETQNSFHLNYEFFVGTELERLGGNEENAEFRMNFRLLWPMTSKLLFDQDVLIAAADVQREIHTPELRYRRVAGIDLARKRDCTVITLNEIGEQVLPEYNPGTTSAEKFRSFRNSAKSQREEEERLARKYFEKTFIGWKEAYGRWSDQVRECADYLQEYEVSVVCVDGTGVGDPICEQLADALPHVLVIPIVFGAFSKDKIYKHYVQEVEAGRQWFAAGEETESTPEYKQFLREHTAMERRFSGIYLCPAAPEGENDDYCSSAALSCWAAEQTPVEIGTGVTVEANPLYTGGIRARQGEGRSRSDRYR